MNKKNKEGYSDPTAYAAISKIEQNETQLKKLRSALNQVCELSGFRLKGPITFVERRTGHTYKV